MKPALLTLCSALVLTALASADAINPPPNDTAAKATPLTGTYSHADNLDLAGATAAALDPFVDGAPVGPSVWYSFTFPVQGHFSVTIDDATGVRAGLFEVVDFDNPAGSLRLIQQTQNVAGGDVETLSADLMGGRRVLLVIGGKGKFGLTHRFNYLNYDYDFPTSPRELPSVERGTTGGSNIYATTSADEPALPGNLNISHTVWCRWTTPFTDKAFLDTNFSYVNSGFAGTPVSAHHTVLAVFREENDGTLTSLATDKDSGYGVNSRLSFSAETGRSYLIAVGTVPNYNPGEFSLNFYRGNSDGQLYFQSSTVGAGREGDGTIPFTLRRRYADTVMTSCKVQSTNGGSATPNVDFNPFSHSIMFTATGADTDWEEEATITVLTDPDPEPIEFVNVAITNPSGNATVKPGNNQFYIFDQDYQGTTFTRPLQYEIHVREDAGFASIPVVRDGDVSSDLNLDLELDSASAKYGPDFAPSQSGNYIAAGSELGMASVKIVDDNVFEGDEYFLVNFDSGNSCLVSIEDDDPYLPVSGRFAASLYYASYARTAVITASLSPSGWLTGRITLQDQALPLKGQLDERGKIKFTLVPKGRPPLRLTIAASDSFGGFNLSLYDFASQMETTDTATLLTYNAKANPYPLAGYYTLAANGPVNGSVPTGAVGGVVASKSGAVRVVGRIVDGTPFSTMATIDPKSNFVASAILPGKRGALGFRGYMPSAAGVQAVGWVQFNLPGQVNSPTKLGPQSGIGQLGITAYTPPAPGKRVLAVWENNGGQGLAKLSKGGLPASLTKSLAIAPNNMLLPPVDPEALKLKLIGKTGLFRGSVILTAGGKPRSITGAFSQISGTFGYGAGFFCNDGQVGEVRLTGP
jgi:hypothetical protein